MLVLVSQMLESCFARLRHKLESIIAVFLLFVPTFCIAQSDQPGIDTDFPAQFSQSEKSVLVLVGGESSNSASANKELPESDANGSASINNQSSGSATFTRQVMSPAPTPPEDLLIPANPSTSTFIRPLANELRGETILQHEGITPTEDRSTQRETESEGSNALGTFATTNQSFQDQRLTGGSQFVAPNQERFNFQAPSSNVVQFGQSSGAGLPLINLGAQFSTQSPSFSGSTLNTHLPVSDKPSEWRDAPSVRFGQPNNIRSGLAPTQQSALNVRSFIAPANQASGGLSAIQSGNSIPLTYNARAYGQTNDLGNNVRPIGFNQPTTQPRFSTNLAKLLIERYSVDNATESLPGRPTKLIEMLRQPISTQQRRPMVHQYWETYYDWANYVSTQQYQQWLTQIPSLVSSSDKAMLEAAIAVAGNKTLAAEIQLNKSQSGLLQYMPNWRSSDHLPLPNDLPLIQKYKTNYELYRSRQLMPVSLRGIDKMLPKTLELITRRAEAVKLTKVAADQILNGLSTGQSDLTSILEAGRVWRAAERDLVASVVSYNQAIGDYSMSVTGGYQAPEEVVAMLIAKPQTIVAQASSELGRPAQFNSKGLSNLQIGNQNRLQPQPLPERQPQPGIAGFRSQATAPPSQNPAANSRWGQGVESRQSENDGTGGTKDFNLGAPDAFRLNPGNAASGSTSDSASRSVLTPAATPINNGAIGMRPVARTNSGFGQVLPAQKYPAVQSNDRSAGSTFGSNLGR